MTKVFMDESEKIPVEFLAKVGGEARVLYERTIGSVGLTQYLSDIGVALTDGHFVYSKGGHGSDYVNIKIKDVEKLMPIAMQMAYEVCDEKFDVIVGAPHGADNLASLVAIYYYLFSGFSPMLLKLLKSDKSESGMTWYKEDVELIRGRTVLLVEDVTNSSGSLIDTGVFIKESEGIVKRCAIVCERVSPENLGAKVICLETGADKVSVVVSINVDNYPVNWDEDPTRQCPLCKKGVPINTRLGHGKKYLEHIENKFPESYNEMT